MIVCYFNVKCVTVFPVKADPPLIVDPYTILPLAIALQDFEPVARRNPEVFQVPCPVKVQELTAGNRLDRAKPRYDLIMKESLSSDATKGPDHQL